MTTTRTLYRPVGQLELDLIKQSGFREFPPRLPEQPIFYPVLNEQYAAEIAQRWNTKDPTNGSVGYVTRFEVDADYLDQFEVQVVGRPYHQELWVPAEQLDEFNRHIVGSIDLVRRFTARDK